MVFSARLELKLGQSLVMTPQLQQAIKLLQMPNIELAAYIAEQVEKNPLLEQAEEDWVGGDAHAEPRGDEAAPSVDSHVSADEVIAAPTVSAAKEEALDADPAGIYAHDSDAGRPGGEGGSGPAADWSGAGGSSSFDLRDFDFESTLSEDPTLREHLVRQLETSALRGFERAIGAVLIDSLDEAGYLGESVADIAERLGAPAEDVEAVLGKLQDFDPTGVFARSLSECLRLQLAERNRLDPAMQALLDNLELLAQRDFRRLTEVCGVDMEDLSDMIAEVRALNPKPGLAFAKEIVETVAPDVYVARNPDGSWRVELDSTTLPRILVNQSYYAEIAGAAKGKEDKTYISSCYNDASWLVKSLDQRARTILKVVSEIVRQQEAFLLHGVYYLKPLNLKTVADAVGVHESTVSRVTSNKYVSTPRGILELKYFFTSAIASADGVASHSAESVRHRIKKMIDEESPSAILSDDKIVKILRASDIDIARRTVVKYRESMKIPSSIQRRRLKRSALGFSDDAMPQSGAA